MSQQAVVSSRFIDTERIPWVPLSPGLSFKPLRFLRNELGRIQLLRLEPGTIIPRHRHTGEVHGFNLVGQRKLLDTGELVGPGGYVYEPAGNVDSWMAVGTEPVIVHVTAYGAVEYLDERGDVVKRATCLSQFEAYRSWCQKNGIPMLDLQE
ncbi:anti-sigma factor [Archangium violaceum]|uniref:cupin domain-containing protein n=1 Tax=Archangium violaceum TaxID=83451 RepID=UPI002B2BED21|nr:anti-sigma factor [Archangium violaceum]